MPSYSRKHQLTNSLLYHIFNRGNARSEIFHSPKDYQKFKDILFGYSKKNNLRIYHWVLMPNHYHLLLELAEPENLSAIMAGVARSYVHYHHKTYQSAGHLWQDRFKSQAIEKETYLLACGRYIERNPVKAGMVGAAEDYKYSSAQFYVFDKTDDLTSDDPMFVTFGENIEERGKNYGEFLLDFNEHDELDFDKLEAPLGGGEFLKRLIREKGLFAPKRQGRPKAR